MQSATIDAKVAWTLGVLKKVSSEVWEELRGVLAGIHQAARDLSATVQRGPAAIPEAGPPEAPLHPSMLENFERLGKYLLCRTFELYHPGKH